MRLATAALVLLCMFAAGCRRVVLIDSDPSGATIRVNGVPQGRTPAKVPLDYTAFSNFEVTLERAGYHTATARLPMELNAGALVCGIACFPVLLWLQQPAHTVFVLDPLEEAGGPGTAAPVPAGPDVTTGASKPAPTPPPAQDPPR